jgi:hypothetical protein
MQEDRTRDLGVRQKMKTEALLNQSRLKDEDVEMISVTRILDSK